MKIKTSSYLLIAVIVVALLMGVFSFMLPSIKVGLLPAIASWFVFVLAIIQLRRELNASRAVKKETLPDNAQLKSTDKSESLKYIQAFGWMIGLVLAIYLVGFLVAVPIFMLFYLKLHSHGWFKSVVLTAVAVILMYAVFVLAMQVNLFPGVAFGAYF